MNIILRLRDCRCPALHNQAPSRGVTLCKVAVPESIREFCRCKVLRPLLRQLRGGVTPRRLAWSIAPGIVVGINPSVGITMLLGILITKAERRRGEHASRQPVALPAFLAASEGHFKMGPRRTLRFS